MKLFEVRDRATFIPVMAVKLTPYHSDGHRSVEQWLLQRAGYALEQMVGNPALEPYVVLWRLEGGPAEYDPHAWGNRTMTVAHGHIIESWEKLQSGDVVDVEYILGHSMAPKQSERLDGVTRGLWQRNAT